MKNELTRVLGRIVLTTLAVLAFAAIRAAEPTTVISDGKFASLSPDDPDAPHLDSYFTSCTSAQENACYAWCTESMDNYPGQSLWRTDCVQRIQWFPVYLSAYSCQCTMNPTRSIDIAGPCYFCM